MILISEIRYNNKFNLNQQEVYKKNFDENIFKEKGIMPSKGVLEGQNGYIVALRHPVELAEAISKLSETISDFFPSVTYNKSNIHTTIATYNILTGENQELDPTVLDEIIQQAHSNLQLKNTKIKMPIPNMGYENGSFLYNSDTVICTGMPDVNFTNIIARITEPEYNTKGYQIKPTWGSHITVSRFADGTTLMFNSQEILSEILRQAKKLPKTQPTSVDFGWFTLDKNEFNLTVYESFRFK